MKHLVAAVAAALCLTGCAWIARNDPEVPANSANSQDCGNGLVCRNDDQECPLEGTTCIDVATTPCEGEPCAVGAARSRKKRR